MAEELRLPLGAVREFLDGHSYPERVVSITRGPGFVDTALSFDNDELNVLKAVLENPHPALRENPETMEIIERLFNDIKGLM